MSVAPEDGSGAVVVVRSHPRCAWHVPPLGHPDTPLRLRVVLEALEEEAAGRWKVEREAPLPPVDQTEGVLRWVHDAAHIERVREATTSAPTTLDSQDCPVSDGSFDAATAAAGLALAAALDVANGRVWRAFLAVRPPSHHARRDRAAGFCFFNSVALAAEVLVRAWNQPVLVVDFDAEHGAGTQEHFDRRGDVGYVSVHHWPTLTGGGGGDEVGSGPGRGLTRNVPVATGSGDDEVCAGLELALEEVGARLRPAALVVSAGFNGHRDDPTGGLAMSREGYARVTRSLVQAAEAWGRGRIVSLLEGGFATGVLGPCAATHVAGLATAAAVVN